jgi:lysophospholipase L1-like esterase
VPTPPAIRRALAGALLTLAAVGGVPASAATDDPCARPGAILGTDRSDYLVGTMGDDVICGLGGNDVIDGLGGNDLIIGGDGDDTLYGRAGNDTLYGGPGDDVLYGGSGADLLRGGPGTDRATFDPADTWRGMEVNLSPATGNLVVGIGDSNMASGQQGYVPDAVPVGLPMTIWPGYVDPLSFLAQGVALTGGRALYGGGFGEAGRTTSQIFGGQLDRALAQRPRAIVIVAGTNNITVGEPWATQAKDDYRAATSKIAAAGVTPVLTTLLPRDDGRAPQTLAFNDWLRSFAASRGYPLADLHAVLSTADGRFLPGTNRDSLHLNAAGARLAGTALGQTLTAALPPVPAALATPRGKPDDLATLFGNPLFLADADADGWPDGVTGGALLQVTTATDPAHAVGRVLRVAHQGTDACANITVPVRAGQRVYVTGRLRTLLEQAGGEFAIRAQGMPGYVPLWETRLARDLPKGSVLPPVTFTVPSGTTSVVFALSLKRGGSFELGQFTVAEVPAG